MTTEISPSRSTSDEQKSPDPEAVPRPRARRRQFTVEYRLSVLRKADACTEPGQIGALLRREGLYSSHLGKWRRQRDEAARTDFDQPRGRRPADPKDIEVAALRREVATLTKKLSTANMVIDVQKKVSALLGIALDGAEPGTTR